MSLLRGKIQTLIEEWDKKKANDMRMYGSAGNCAFEIESLILQHRPLISCIIKSTLEELSKEGGHPNEKSLEDAVIKRIQAI